MTENDYILRELVSWYFRNPEPAEKIFPCPGEETLYDYFNDKLDPEVKEDVERHLCQCESCLQTLLVIPELLEDAYVPVESDVPAHVRKTVLAHVPSDRSRVLSEVLGQIKKSISFFIELADLLSFKRKEFVYVRGHSKVISRNLVVFEKVFKEIKFEIEIEKINANASNIKVKTIHPQTGAPLSGVRINICDNTREVASFVAVRGEALFENMVFGKYRLMAWENKKKLGEILLTIKE